MKGILAMSFSLLVLATACSSEQASDKQPVVPRIQEDNQSSIKQSINENPLSQDERRILKDLEVHMSKTTLRTSESAEFSPGTSSRGALPSVGGCTPRIISGSGDTILDITMQSACRFATGQHSGDSNFIVSTLDSNGKDLGAIFNEIGRYSGQRAWNDSRASYQSLSVRADGRWTIDIR
jgi:hypothetical protein